ncbi:hypothetical protein [Halomonas salinarum]|nr:hypothetical protein [Halomonas salinarum]
MTRNSIDLVAIGTLFILFVVPSLYMLMARAKQAAGDTARGEGSC